jgi:hypothetical protein
MSASMPNVSPAAAGARLMSLLCPRQAHARLSLLLFNTNISLLHVSYAQTAIGQTAACMPYCCYFPSKIRPQALTVCLSCRPPLCRQLHPTVQAKRRGGWSDSSSSSRGRGSSKDDKSFRFKFNQIDVSLAEDQLWRLALPFAALFGLAVFIGKSMDTCVCLYMLERF